MEPELKLPASTLSATFLPTKSSLSTLFIVGGDEVKELILGKVLPLTVVPNTSDITFTGGTTGTCSDVRSLENGVPLGDWTSSLFELLISFEVRSGTPFSSLTFEA